MRIGFVSDVVYPWNKGGVEATEALEMRSLAKRHEVYCFSMQFKGMRKEFVRDRIHYITVANTAKRGIYTEGGTRSINAARLFAEALPEALDMHRLDVLQVNAFPYLHLRASKRYCSRTNCKLVLDVAEVWDRRRWAEYLGTLRGSMAHYYLRLAQALNGADAYIANSSTTKAGLGRLGVSSSKIHVFSPVLSGSIMRSRHSSRRSMNVIVSGRLIKEKRFDMWIEAVAKAHALRGSITGTIMGDGPERAALDARIMGLHLERCMRVLPFAKSKAGLYKRIAGSGLLLQTSGREGLSAIVLESLALGTPVLLPSDTPIPDEVKSMCVLSKPEDLPNRIVEILGSSNRKKYLPSRSALRQFSSSAILGFYSSLFQKLGLERK